MHTPKEVWKRRRWFNRTMRDWGKPLCHDGLTRYLAGRVSRGLRGYHRDDEVKRMEMRALYVDNALRLYNMRHGKPSTWRKRFQSLRRREKTRRTQLAADRLQRAMYMQSRAYVMRTGAV